MEAAYTTEAWHDLYILVGSAAAVLMGLVFVALSLHLGPITHNADWRGRARGSITSLFAVVLISILVLVPNQPHVWLGIELLAFGLLGTTTALRNQVRVLRTMGAPFQRVFSYALADLGSILVAFAGLSVALERFGGLYWLVPATLVMLLFSTLSSWQLMVAVGEGLHDTPTSKERVH